MDEIRNDYNCNGNTTIDGTNYCPPTLNRFKAADPLWRGMMGEPSPITASLSDANEKRVIDMLKAVEIEDIKFDHLQNSEVLSLASLDPKKIPNPARITKLISAGASRYLDVLNTLQKNGESPSASGKFIDRPFLERMKLGADISADDFNRLFEVGGRVTRYQYKKTDPNGEKNMTLAAQEDVVQ